MATSSTWTVVMEDKMIIKQVGDGAGNAYTIDDNTFWSQSDFSNIWAIQYGTSPSSDEVEYRDDTPHSTFADTGISFQQFIDKWDSAHLAKLQADWDADERDESEKGARPTSYSS